MFEFLVFHLLTLENHSTSLILGILICKMEARTTTAYGCCAAEIREYIQKQHSIWHRVGTPLIFIHSRTEESLIEEFLQRYHQSKVQVNRRKARFWVLDIFFQITEVIHASKNNRVVKWKWNYCFIPVLYIYSNPGVKSLKRILPEPFLRNYKHPPTPTPQNVAW